MRQVQITKLTIVLDVKQITAENEMSKTPNTEFVSRAGVHYTGYIFSMAGIIFRENPNTDVGIDGQIELVDSTNNATGMLAGVQIKSGNSFVDSESETFTFRAERKHFEYWKQFCLPVVGVVFCPSLEKAVWFDLSKHSRDIHLEGEPLEIKGILNPKNELEPLSGLPALVKRIREYHGLAVSKEEVEKIAYIQEEHDENGELDPLDEEIAWKRLVTIFFASDSNPDVIADVGYRLSRYFPSVPEAQKFFFIDRIVRATNEELVRIVSAVHQALIDNRDDVASLIVDLIHYLPNNIHRLMTLEQSNTISDDQLWALRQAIEYLSLER